MHTATLIDDLVATVERAETGVRIRAEQPNSRNWFAMAPAEPSAFEAAAQLRGVA
jgi:methyl coenzyme M reductase gamma subunit